MSTEQAAEQHSSRRVALIVGASRGIGAATAQAWARRDVTVVLAARDQHALESVVRTIRSEGGAAASVVADVTDEDSMRNLVDRTVSSFGRLDYAFNNATGGHRPAPVADVEASGFDLALSANVRGVFLGMKYQIPAMLESGGGAVVNMASAAALQPAAGLAGYVASKIGIIGLSAVAALDYAGRGVRVNVVAPGPILTERLTAAGEDARTRLADSVPMARLGTPAEVAETVIWLCSDAASFITGVALPIDGGMTAGQRPPQGRT